MAFSQPNMPSSPLSTMTSPSTPHSFPPPTYYTSQSAIDEEISRLYERIRELRSARNALSPISRIPPEVLVQVFGWLQDLFRLELNLNSYQLTKNQRDLLEVVWTRVTRVSSQWRGIARGFPGLWNNVALTNFLFLEESSLTCSYPLPLILEKRRLGMYHLTALHKALDSFPRFKIFSITESRMRLDSVSPYFSQPAPELEVFRLLGPSRTVNLPNDMFKGVSPRLRQVALGNFSLSWNKATFLDNLTTLTVHSPVSRVSIDIFANILRRMPGLVSLDMIDVLEIMSRWTEDENAYFASMEPVYLPSLESLSFEGSFFNQDHAFITRLRFPGQTQVKFHSALEITVIHAFPQILNAFMNSRMEEVKAITSLTFLCEKEADRTVATLSWDNASSSPALSAVGDLTADPKPPPKPSSISLEGGHAIQHFAADWLLELHSLSLGTLEHLTTNVDVASEIMWTALGDLSNLKTVSLTGPSGAFLLRHIVDDHAAAAFTTVSLPSLRKIHLTETNFENIQVQSLVQAFASRKSNGSPLAVLSLQDCRNIPKDLVSELKGIIENVDWDGNGVNNDEEIPAPDYWLFSQ